MYYVKVCLTITTILVTASIGLATTIHVPADQPTIQAGIDAAVNGDSVLVSPGTYHETVDFLGKRIVVRGENGPLSTIISGALDTLTRQTVSFISGEDSSSIIEQFTIRGGTRSRSREVSPSGILCDDSSPTIRDNIIIHNYVGIQCLDASSPTILHNYIGGNELIGLYCCDVSAPLAENNVINRNGVGIHMEDWTSPRLIDNVIGWNGSARDYAGMLIEHYSEPTIEGNIIVGNRATLFEAGGGVHIHDPTVIPIIRRNLIIRNGFSYGGIDFDYISMRATIEHNTIVGNNGDGIYLAGTFPEPKFVRNNIIMDNAGHGIGWDDLYYPDSVDVSFNDITGNGEGEFGHDAAPDTGNISADPLFRLEGWFDYSLLASSPCIDAGDPKTAVPEGGGDRVDIGAFEYSIPFNDIALTFISIPDTISKGDTLDLELCVTNPLQSPIVIDVWCTASGWPGSQTVQEFRDLAVPADTTIPLSVSVYVPLEIDAGQYNIHGKVGYVDEWIADAENAIVQVED
jgi:parallel beta-helix repeat protein